MKGGCLDYSWVTCHFKEEPTTCWHCSSQRHRLQHCCTSFLIPFEVFLHHWTYSVSLGSPLIQSLIIAILCSKFPKVRQCLKWLVFVGAYKFTLCANSGKSWGIPPLRVLETSLPGIRGERVLYQYQPLGHGREPEGVVPHSTEDHPWSLVAHWWFGCPRWSCCFGACCQWVQRVNTNPRKSQTNDTCPTWTPRKINPHPHGHIYQAIRPRNDNLRWVGQCRSP